MRHELPQIRPATYLDSGQGRDMSIPLGLGATNFSSTEHDEIPYPFPWRTGVAAVMLLATGVTLLATGMTFMSKGYSGGVAFAVLGGISKAHAHLSVVEPIIVNASYSFYAMYGVWNLGKDGGDTTTVTSHRTS